MSNVEADSGGSTALREAQWNGQCGLPPSEARGVSAETEAGTTQRDVVRLGVRSIAVKFSERCPARSAMEWATRLVGEHGDVY